MSGKFSVYNNARANEPIGDPFQMERINAIITSGGKDEVIKNKVLSFRKMIEEGKLEEYKQQKLTLPAIAFSGVFGKRGKDSFIEHSSFLIFDYDDLEDVDKFKSDISKEDGVIMVFVSPSGKGVKVVKKLEEVPKKSEHVNAYNIVSAKSTQGFDAAQQDVSRLCFMSYDPDAYFNPDVKGLKWREEYKAFVLESESLKQEKVEQLPEQVEESYEDMPVYEGELEFSVSGPANQSDIPSNKFYDTVNLVDMFQGFGMDVSAVSGEWTTLKWPGVASMNAMSVNGRGFHIFSDTVYKRWESLKNQNGKFDPFRIYLFEKHNHIITDTESWKTAQKLAAADGFGEWRETQASNTPISILQKDKEAAVRFIEDNPDNRFKISDPFLDNHKLQIHVAYKIKEKENGEIKIVKKKIPFMDFVCFGFR